LHGLELTADLSAVIGMREVTRRCTTLVVALQVCLHTHLLLYSTQLLAAAIWNARNLTSCIKTEAPLWN